MGDAVPRGFDIDEPDAETSLVLIDQALERNRHELAGVERDQHRVAALQQVLRRAVAEVTGVLHVGRHGIRAAQLVADVLGDRGDPEPELRETDRDLGLENLAEVHLGDADMAVLVPLDVGELLQIAGIQLQHQPFGHDRDTVAPPLAPALDHRAGERVDDGLQPHALLGKRFRYQGQRGPRRLADAEREVPCLAAHGDQKVPAGGGLGVDHEVLDDLDAVVAGGLEAERLDVRRQVEIVVYGLRHVHDAQPARTDTLQLHGGERGVVAADGDELRDVQPQQRGDDVLEQLGVRRRIGARGCRSPSRRESESGSRCRWSAGSRRRCCPA